MSESHYDWLDKHLPIIFKELGINDHEGAALAHGDKFYGSEDVFEDLGLSFAQGVAIGLLSYEVPFSSELRKYDPSGNWIDFECWIRTNHHRFNGVSFLNHQD